MTFLERNNHESSLRWSLDDGFANDSSNKESPERNTKVATCDSSQIKQGIWNLRCYFRQEMTRITEAKRMIAQNP